jgi:hypothetical protein
MISRIIVTIVIAAVVTFAQSPTPTPQAAKPYFIAIFSKGPAWDEAKQANEQAGFKEHSENLKRLRADKRIPIGGRYADKGMVIVTASNETQAKSLFAGDVMLEKRTFTLEVYEFRPFYRGSIE